jgi:hypothetical protein
MHHVKPSTILDSKTPTQTPYFLAFAQNTFHGGHPVDHERAPFNRRHSGVYPAYSMLVAHISRTLQIIPRLHYFAGRKPVMLWWLDSLHLVAERIGAAAIFGCFCP